GEGRGNARARAEGGGRGRGKRGGGKPAAGRAPRAARGRKLRMRGKPPAPPSKYAFPTIINAVAFTPDGKQIVASGHHELTVWNIADGKLAKRIYTRAERAYGMAFMADGKLVVAGARPGQEGDVRGYDINAAGKTENGVTVLNGVDDTKVMLKQLLDSDDSVLALAISPDGKKLAAGGCDRTVRVWDISSGVLNAKLEQTVENHADWVLSVALASDDKHLFTFSRDKTAKVWDLATKESVLTCPDHQNPVYGVAMKPDGSVGYSAGDDKQVRTWNAKGEGKQIRTVGGHTEAVLKLVAHPKQPLLISASA